MDNVLVRRQVLEKNGFRYCKNGLFIRNCNGQIQGVEFQKSQYADCYYINLGMQYAFIPNYYAVMAKRKSLTRFADSCEFLFSMRYIDPHNKQHCFDYPKTVHAYEVQLEEQVLLCLKAFQEFNEKWGDPRKLLKLNLLDVLRGVRSDESNICKNLHKINDLFDFFKIAAVSALCFSLGRISIHFGETDLSKEFFKEGMNWEELEGYSNGPCQELCADFL